MTSLNSPESESQAQAQAELRPAIVPVNWLIGNGPPSVQYRTIRDIVGLAVEDPPFHALPYASRTGIQLMLMQDAFDGLWPGGMLTVPTPNTLAGVGTIIAYRRLLELGWDPESPALACTKRLLFRLLAEDDDPSFLAEYRPEVLDEDLVNRGRLILREAAAAALAQAGYENDPRLRGAASRLTEPVAAYLKSPLSSKPWMRIGNQHVLPPEVHAPSFHLLIMLAHMPHFRSEHHELMDRLFHYLSQPWPRQQPVQQVGPHLLDQPHLVLGDLLPTRNVMDSDMPSSLAWLEIIARLGFLDKNENWTRLLDRLLGDRDRKGIWHAPRSVAMPETIPSWSWPSMPLVDMWMDEEEAKRAHSIEITFRLGLIASLAGRTIEPT